MIWATLAVLVGLQVLIWSAERFIHGAAFTANYYGISPLFVGMFIIGFGTSAPEIIVSIFAAIQGSGGLALGNAFGSNITNITLVLGTTALLSPIMVQSDIVRKELPILLAVTFFVLWQLLDLQLSHDDAFALLGIFILLILWSVWQTLKRPEDPLGEQVANDLTTSRSQLKSHLFWLILGLVLLVLSSKMLVWGAVEIAKYFNVSDVIVGLTIVGIGTSLPELMSSIIAVRKNEHELAIGNVVGSNLFNSLAVIGIAGIIQPVQLDATFLFRDGLLMLGVTVALLIFCLGVKGANKISRPEGFALVMCFIGYNLYLLLSQF